MSWIYWQKSAIPAPLRKLKQEDRELEVNLGNIVRPCLKGGREGGRGRGRERVRKKERKKVRKKERKLERKKERKLKSKPGMGNSNTDFTH
jgi:hypothetical protein